jgi:hypothetical protein
MAFKTKTKNRLLVDDRQTLDAKHNSILQSFEENKNQLPELKSHLLEIQQEIDKLNQQNSTLVIIDLKLQNEIWRLDDQKKELEKIIYNIENNIEETEYMVKTGKLLSEYYKILDTEKQFASNLEITPSGITINSSNLTNTANSTNAYGNKKKSIMDWFAAEDVKILNIPPESQIAKTSNGGRKSKKSKSINLNDQIDANINPNTSYPESDINPFSDKLIRPPANKDIIYEKYMKMIDKNYINITAEEADVFDTCSKCLVEMLLNNNTGSLICPKCGISENIIVDSDKPSFKEPPKEMTSFCYKRINHFNEFLAQFQAKETTDIPEDVYNEILMEIKKERITNMAYITPVKMRELLKRIRKNDYYEHIPYIINQLNGLPAPVISPEIEEISRGMFKAIQIPFEKYCPPKRKNFLSYSYIMYKFFELLELDEYLRCFQLLKSRTKLHQQDEIWKNICKDLNWQFIKSL